MASTVSRSSPEAARQASLLARDGAALAFVTVAHASGTGLSAAATIGDERARASLEEMERIAAENGVSADSRLVTGRDPSRELLAQAAGCDLLVVASHGTSRRAGIMLGSVASTAVHRADQTGFRGEASAAGHLSRSEEATGREPVLRSDPGEPHEHIRELAGQIGASLVVVGSRGLAGLKALGSVSERIAHRAPCPVLVDREHRPDAALRRLPQRADRRAGRGHPGGAVSCPTSSSTPGRRPTSRGQRRGRPSCRRRRPIAPDLRL